MPVLLLLFYRASETPTDSDIIKRRIIWAQLGVFLAAMASIDPRFSIAQAFFLWTVLLTGWIMHGRFDWQTWKHPVKGLSLASLTAALVYLPFWLYRRWHPEVFQPMALPENGLDFLLLWRASAGYLGWTTIVLATAGLIYSLSYRAQTRLWAWVAVIHIWLGLGDGFTVSGNYVWRVPALYKGFERIPWLGGPPPLVYLAFGRLALSLLAAYGFGALFSRMPPTVWRRKWLRHAIGATLAILCVLDLLR